ncbi:hypothetical protein DPSP01_003356 [Paraphaeosphaeria sporulosa]
MSESPGPRRRRQTAPKSSRPCDACRRRKTRCIVDTGQQTCNVCIQKKNDCTFLEHPPKRSVPAPVQPSDEEVRIPSVPSPSQVLSPRYNASPTVNLGAITVSDGLETQNHTAEPLEQTEDFERSLGLNSTKFAELYGLGSDMEPILMRHRPYSAVYNEYTLPTHSIRRVLGHDQNVDYPVTFHMGSDIRSALFEGHHHAVDSIEACVKPHGEKLLRLFWKLIHPSYPIIHKDGFIDRYKLSYRHIDAPLLGAVYLNAINWWFYDSNLSNQPAIDVTTLRRLTLQHIQDSYHRPRLTSIEATLLLLQCKPEDPLNPDHTFAWGLTSQALSVGQACGLHLDASAWAIPSWERTLRKRVSWAIYMQDVWTALAHGRPSHISEDDWGVLPLNEVDFESTENVSFLYLQSLTTILHTVLKTFYTVKSTTQQDTLKLKEQAQPILSSLDQWHSALPPSLAISNIPARELCANGNIHLAYYGVKINVLRRLVRSTALAPLCLDMAALTAIRVQAHETAQQATSLVASLRLEHLDGFWYFATPYLFSVIGSFLTLLLVTSLTPAERDHWRESLRAYLWTLRLMSKTNEPIRYAVNRLEGAILRGLEHALEFTVEGTSPVAFEATPGHFNADPDAFALGFGFTEGFDATEMDLDAFDFLSNATLG